MATTIEVEPTREALLEAVQPITQVLRKEQLLVTPYDQDDRNGWDTYLVSIEGYGVWGYTDGPILD
jgi:hypothetical protein